MRTPLLLLCLLVSLPAFGEETDAEAHRRVTELERTCQVLAEKAEARLAKNTPEDILGAARTFERALALDAASETETHSRLLVGLARAKKLLYEIARPALVLAETALLHSDRETVAEALRAARAIDPYEETATAAARIEAKLTTQIQMELDPCETWLATLLQSVETNNVRELLDARRGLRALMGDAKCSEVRWRALEVEADCLNRLARIVDGALEMMRSDDPATASQGRALALIALADPELSPRVIGSTAEDGLLRLRVDFGTSPARGVSPRLEQIFRGSPHGDGTRDPLGSAAGTKPRG